jgi:hypothetical protein
VAFASEDRSVNTTLTRDRFFELVDFLEEPDEETTGPDGADA